MIENDKVVNETETDWAAFALEIGKLILSRPIEINQQMKSEMYGNLGEGL